MVINTIVKVIAFDNLKHYISNTVFTFEVLSILTWFKNKKNFCSRNILNFYYKIF